MATVGIHTSNFTALDGKRGIDGTQNGLSHMDALEGKDLFQILVMNTITRPGPAQNFTSSFMETLLWLQCTIRYA